MDQTSYCGIIRDQTSRALWEVGNVIDCIPDDGWAKLYYNMPVWKHVYHMLHSLDLYLINPRDKSFAEPPIHESDLNNLDVPSSKTLTRPEINGYFSAIKEKSMQYLSELRDEDLLTCPEDCEYTRFTLILAQHRHLHTHMGMLMGFIVNDTGQWPMVVGLAGSMPAGDYNKFG